MEQNGNQHTILNLSDINLTETSENNYKWQKLREITENRAAVILKEQTWDTEF